MYRRENRHPLWNTNTTGQDVQAAVMQADGNLVLYTFDHRQVWGSETEHQGPTWLRLLETGHLEIAGVRGVWGVGVPQIPGPSTCRSAATR